MADSSASRNERVIDAQHRQERCAHRLASAVGDIYYVVGGYRDVLLFAVHYLSYVYSYLLLLPGYRVFTEDDRAVGSGRVLHALRERDRLPERGAFFEDEGAGRVHIASN